jgi:predicted P-loop ATPase
MTIDLNDAPPQSEASARRHVQWTVIKEVVKGHETEILDALAIDWPSKGHITCPYPDHIDNNPSWRWDAEAANARCSCDSSASIFDVAMKVRGLDFMEAAVFVAETLGRTDLINEETPTGLTLEEYAAAKRFDVEWLKERGVTTLAEYGPDRLPAVRTTYFRVFGNNKTASVRFRVNLTGDKKKRHFWRKGEGKGKTVCLYGCWNAPHLPAIGYVILVEGESDTQTLWLHGFPALGLPGASNWNEDRDAELFDGVAIIYVVIEDDKGGEEVMRWLSKSRIAPRVRLIEMPPKTKDPSALYLSAPDHFREAFKALMDEAKPLAIQPQSMSTAWRAKLIKTESGVPLRILANAIIAFEEAPEWQGRLSWDVFHLRMMIEGPPPWPELGNQWGDAHDIRAAAWLQHNHVLVDKRIAGQAAYSVARKHQFHPVTAYLQRCVWYGEARLDTWVIDYLGAPDTPYARAVGARWVISAVARVMEPGCKADCAVILEGPQGLLKSTAIKTLASPWFTDGLSEFGSKDAAQELAGVWIVELAELDALKKAEVSRVKAFMSRATDRYRPPYATHVIQQPRQCIFGGTVNPSEYLRDATGARRFWPIKCTKIDIPGLTKVRDQLWAEARVRYERGEQWWLDASLEKLAGIEQEERRVEDEWEPVIADILQRTEPLCISVRMILRIVLNIEASRWDQVASNRVVTCLHRLGWAKDRLGKDVDVKIFGDPPVEYGRENLLGAWTLKRGERVYKPDPKFEHLDR